MENAETHSEASDQNINSGNARPPEKRKVLVRMKKKTEYEKSHDPKSVKRVKVSRKIAPGQKLQSLDNTHVQYFDATAQDKIATEVETLTTQRNAYIQRKGEISVTGNTRPDFHTRRNEQEYIFEREQMTFEPKIGPDGHIMARSVIGDPHKFFQMQQHIGVGGSQDESFGNIDLALPSLDDRRDHLSHTAQFSRLSSAGQSIGLGELKKSDTNSSVLPSHGSSLSTPELQQQQTRAEIEEGKAFETLRTKKKLKELLEGDQIYMTREKRALARWNEQQKQWDRMKKSIARRCGKEVGELAITRAEEYREMLEEVDLLSKSMPPPPMTPDHWEYSLRGNQDTEYVIPVGGIFSGLYCKVKEDREPTKHIVRKPRPPPRIEVVQDDDGQINLAMDVADLSQPGVGAASKNWHERTDAFKIRQKFHARMQELQPISVDHTDGLEIVGTDLFSLEVELPAYSVEKRIEETQRLLEETMHELKGSLNSSVAFKPSASGSFGQLLPTIVEALNQEDVEPSEQELKSSEPDTSEIANPQDMHQYPGPCLTLDHEEVQFDARVDESVVATSTIKNIGTTAMFFWLPSLNQQTSHGTFTYEHTTKHTILPGQSEEITIQFRASKPGAYYHKIPVYTLPEMETAQSLHLYLQAICFQADYFAVTRQEFAESNSQCRVEMDAAEIVSSIVDRVETPLPSEAEMPLIFFRVNRDMHLYWYESVFCELTELSGDIINAFRRRKRKSLRWDYRVSTLVQWLEDLTLHNDASALEPLNTRLGALIETCSRIPEPDPRSCDVAKALLCNTALEIPRLSWMSKRHAHECHDIEMKEKAEEELRLKQEQARLREERRAAKAKLREADDDEDDDEDDEDEDEDEGDEDEEGSETGSTQDDSESAESWDVCGSEYYLQKLHEQICSKFVEDMSLFEKHLDNEDANQSYWEDVNKKLTKEFSNILVCGAISKRLQLTPLKSLLELGIRQIHTCGEYMIFTNQSEVWACPITQSIEVADPMEPSEEKDSDDEGDSEDEEVDDDDEDDEEDEEESEELHDFSLWPVFDGFCIQQTACSRNAFFLLTSAGDVFGCLPSDPRSSCQEIVSGRHVSKLCASRHSDLCFGICEDDSILSWSYVEPRSEPTVDENPDENEEKEETATEVVLTENQGTEGHFSMIQEVDGFPEEKVVDIGLGQGFCVALLESGRVSVWGDLEQVISVEEVVSDDGDAVDQPSRNRVVSISTKNEEETEEANVVIPISQLEVGPKQIFMITNTGAIYVCGTSELGMLGCNDENTILEPKEVSFSDSEGVRVTMCRTCDAYCFAVDDTDRVWVWGDFNGIQPEKPPSETENDEETKPPAELDGVPKVAKEPTVLPAPSDIAVKSVCCSGDNMFVWVR